VTQNPKLSHRLLAAMVLGLIVCPLVFVAIGGRRDLRPIFFAAASPPVLAATAFLLFRYLARPSVVPPRMASKILEVLSWVVVTTFLVVVSGVNLLVGIERVGASAGIFLVVSLVWLPILIKRRTAIEHRLARLPARGAGLIAGVIAIFAAIAVVANLTTPSRFPGG
jgi:hypothetical protein